MHVGWHARQPESSTEAASLSAAFLAARSVAAAFNLALLVSSPTRLSRTFLETGVWLTRGQK